jgi:hypothetical protein
VANKEYLEMQSNLLSANGEAARYKAIVEDAQKRGLIKVAESLLTPTPTPTPTPTGGNLDATKYFTKDEIAQIAEGEGNAIAMVADIQAEHNRLGLGPISFKDLRAKAKAARKSVEQVWEETYKVPEVRSAKAKADQEAYDKRLRDEGRAAAVSELATKYGNPDTRPMLTSASPLAKRSTSGMRDGSKPPWEQGGGDNGSPLQVERVNRVAAKVSEKFLQ